MELELTTPVTPILLVTKDDVVVIREADGEWDRGGERTILFRLLEDFKEANCCPDNLIILQENNLDHKKKTN